MKGITIIQNITFIVFIAAGSLHAQTMAWVPVQSGTLDAGCISERAPDNVMCYALVYTPAATGLLTSYTTGFFISCTGSGSPVVRNESCSMQGNVRVLDACETDAIVLMNSSGNSGVAGKNDVKAGQPVTLHQVCFQVNANEVIHITEDHVTDLTTSITTASGKAETEFPVFEPMVVRKPPIVIAGDDRPKPYDKEALSADLSPNPASDRIWVNLKGVGSETTLKCIDIHGKLVLQELYTGGDGTVEMNVSRLAPAMYSLLVESDDRSVTHMFAIVE